MGPPKRAPGPAFFFFFWKRGGPPQKKTKFLEKKKEKTEGLKPAKHFFSKNKLAIIRPRGPPFLMGLKKFFFKPNTIF